MIFTSILINIINAIRLRRFWDVLFDRAGLLAAMLYWSGIVLTSRIVTSSVVPKTVVAVLAPVLMSIALILLFFREPIIHLFQGKKKLYPEGALTGVIAGLVELMEIVLGFLANTVSFIRVAAFGLVHAGLAMAIFALSDAVGGVGSFFVIVLGNLLIICLEGLVVTIQAVRLEFYEFFSRFFKESRTGYRPLRSEIMSN
jgi:V/A-type H+-transporting ATPase subunit I